MVFDLQYHFRQGLPDVVTLPQLFMKTDSNGLSARMLNIRFDKFNMRKGRSIALGLQFPDKKIFIVRLQLIFDVNLQGNDKIARRFFIVVGFI